MRLKEIRKQKRILADEINDAVDSGRLGRRNTLLNQMSKLDQEEDALNPQFTYKQRSQERRRTDFVQEKPYEPSLQEKMFGSSNPSIRMKLCSCPKRKISFLDKLRNYWG